MGVVRTITVTINLDFPMATPEELYNLAFRTRRRLSQKKDEETVAAHSYCAELYARMIVKGRFELGEPAMATDAENSSWYLHLTLAPKGQATFNAAHGALLLHNPALEIRYVAEHFKNIDLDFLFKQGINVRLHDGQVWRTLLTANRRMSFAILSELGEQYPIIKQKLSAFVYSASTPVGDFEP